MSDEIKRQKASPPAGLTFAQGLVLAAVIIAFAIYVAMSTGGPDVPSVRSRDGQMHYWLPKTQ
jgi:hypothetical protein